jgi:hypothetical protein
MIISNFYEKIKEYNLNDIICIDETNINALQKYDNKHISRKHSVKKYLP